MDKYRKLGEALKNNFSGNGKMMPLVNAEVKSIDGESCTVAVGDLDLTDVRLKATINEAANYVLVKPKVGSMVVVGSLTGDLKDLCVLSVDEVEKVEYRQNGLEVEIDSVSKKVLLKNDTVSLYDLFASLVDILKTIKVFTPSGPSGTPLPDTIAKVVQLETKFKSILKR